MKILNIITTEEIHNEFVEIHNGFIIGLLAFIFLLWFAIFVMIYDINDKNK